MQQIGLFFGSTDGNTEDVALRIQEMLETGAPVQVDLLDVAEIYLEEMQSYDRLLLGVPTWNNGQLQEDWEACFDELDTLDLSGKLVALFGLGDQIGYPSTFVDALFFLADKVRERGATLVGAWPTSGYTFTNSWAADDDLFVGLVLDEHNQPELTEERLRHWLEMISLEFGLGSLQLPQEHD